MRFVRSLSDALKFRPWLRFWSLVCISSGCGRFVVLWGLWSFVRRFFGFFVALVPFRSSAAFPPCLASYFVRYGLLFCFVGSSSPVVLFSFCGPLDALPLLGVVSLYEFGRVLGVVVVCVFGSLCPLSFWV